MSILKRYGRIFLPLTILIFFSLAIASTSCSKKPTSTGVKKEKKGTEIKRPRLIEFYAPW